MSLFGIAVSAHASYAPYSHVMQMLYIINNNDVKCYNEAIFIAHTVTEYLLPQPMTENDSYFS